MSITVLKLLHCMIHGFIIGDFLAILCIDQLGNKGVSHLYLVELLTLMIISAIISIIRR